MHTILVVGQDEDLLRSRALLLRKCGGVVKAKAAEAVELLKVQRFDLVVVCHTLNMDELNRIAGLAHDKGTDIKVLQVVDRFDVPTTAKSASDRIVTTDPETFMASVEEMLGTSCESEVSQ